MYSAFPAAKLLFEISLQDLKTQKEEPVARRAWPRPPRLRAFLKTRVGSCFVTLLEFRTSLDRLLIEHVTDVESAPLFARDPKVFA